MSVYVQNNGALMGEGSVVSVVDTEDIHGGTIREINAVSLYGDTVTAQTLLLGVTAHNAFGERIVGTYDPGSSTLNLQSKSVTPTMSQQVVTYDIGYDGLSQVTVAAIPYQDGDSLSYGTI